MKPEMMILVGCDFSELGKLAVTTAFAVARNVKAARVHLVHVVPSSMTPILYPRSFDVAALEEIQKKRAKEKLLAITDEDLNVTHEVRIGVPARDLAAAAQDTKADLIVVASHGYGTLKRAVYGSVTGALLRISECPVLVVAEGQTVGNLDAVVAGVDLSSVAPRVVEAALALTNPSGRTQLMTAYEPPVVLDDDDEKILLRIPTAEDKAELRADREAQLRRLIPKDADQERIGIDAFAKAPAANVILECADLLDADLVVIGTSGHNVWHRAFLGSTAMRVLARARCPVLLIPNGA